MTPYYKLFTDKTSIPEPLTLTGTFTSNGNTVTIIGGANELKQGDYLYDQVQNIFRKVLSAVGNKAQIESPFTTDISTPLLIKVIGRTLFNSVSIDNNGSADGYVNGSKLKKNASVKFSSDNLLDPITLDATGTEIAVSGL